MSKSRRKGVWLGDAEASNPRLKSYGETARAIEGLEQQDQVIALLTEQNNMLKYMCDRLAAIETSLNQQP